MAGITSSGPEWRRSNGEPRSIMGQMDTEGGISLGALLRVLWRRKLVILLFSGGAGLLSVFYSVWVAEPAFAARARLMIQVQEKNIVEMEKILSGVSTEESAINTELQILVSRSLVEDLVRDLNLTADPEFNSRLVSPSLLSPAGVMAVARRFLLGPEPELSDEARAEAELIDTVNQVTRALQVSAMRKTYLLDIVVTTSDPRKSQRIANRLAELYLKRQVALKYAITEEAINWLSDRVSELEVELRSKTEAIDSLRQSTALISSEALEVQSVQAKDLRSRINQSEAKLTAQRADLKALRATIAEGDPEAIATQADDVFLNRLLRDLSEGGGAARFAFDQRVEALVRDMEQEGLRLRTQIDALQTSLDRLDDQINAQTRDQTALVQMEREAKATQVLYETFLSRLKEASVQIGLQRADSQVLSEAIPGRKVAPRRMRILIISLFLGAVLGAFYAVVRQVYYQGVRNSEELEEISGLPVLGSVPKFAIRKRQELIPYLMDNPTSPTVEAVRNLRTSLLMHDMNNPSQIICSTSSLPGEGKTTQAIALSLSLASMGRRVLLVDGDIRRSSLNQYLTNGSHAGLVSLLLEDAPIGEAIEKEGIPGVDVMPSGHFKNRAVNLFSSGNFANVLEQLRANYDHVVIDTPPVLLVPDARVIAAQCDTLIYSVKWNSTLREQILEGIRMLTRGNAPIAGLVLSHVDSKQMGYYGHSYGYGGQYHTYTTSQEGKYFNMSE